VTTYPRTVQASRWILLACVAGCGSSGAVDPVGPNVCVDATDLAYCNDFDLPTPEQAVVPFGFAEFLGGELTEVVVIAENGNRGISMRGEGAVFGQSAASPIGSATSASIEATIQPFETAPGKSLTLGMILLDGSSSLGRQVWVVAHADHTLTVDALGISLPTTGTLDPDGLTTVRMTATWMTGGADISLDVLAGPPGSELAPILEDHVIDLAPPPELSCSIAIISLEPGVRRFVFDNVTLELR